MELHYDIIYKIYFWIDDYPTILSFFVLSKTFYENYIKKYNNSYKHRFMILFKKLFLFFKALPFLQLYNENNNESNILKCLDVSYIQPSFKQMIMHDIQFIYNLYKSLILQETIKKLGRNLAPDVTNIILTQGPTHINKHTYIKLNKNKVNIYLCKNNLILALNISLNFMYLRKQFNQLEFHNNSLSILP
jgi:hypothetical protein